MKIKVLGINGSPRQGNSLFLLERALTYVDKMEKYEVKTEIYLFQGKEFKPCLGCGYCTRNNGSCIHNDSFENLKKKWLSANVIIYSVPVYHMSMPGQVKCFIDRLGNSCFANYKNRFKQDMSTLPKFLKIIGAITQGIHIFSGQEHTMTDLINHALVMQSIPVVGDLWESYIGAAGWTRNRDGVNALQEEFERGDKSALTAVRAAEQLALRAVEMAVIVRRGINKEKTYFNKQSHYQPFIRSIK